MDKQKTNEIISAISLECGVEPSTVRMVYIGIVRYVLKTIKFKGICPLPDWGTFRIVKYKPRRTTNINSGRVEQLGERKVIKFDADYKLKHYIKEKV